MIRSFDNRNLSDIEASDRATIETLRAVIKDQEREIDSLHAVIEGLMDDRLSVTVLEHVDAAETLLERQLRHSLHVVRNPGGMAS